MAANLDRDLLLPSLTKSTVGSINDGVVPSR